MVYPRSQGVAQGLVLFFFLFILLQCTKFFSCLLISKGTFNTIIKIESLCLILYLFLNREYIKNICKNAISGNYVLLFCLSTVISTIPCYFNHGQSFIESFKVILSFQFLLYYFIFFKFGVSEKKVLKLFILLSLIKFSISFIQQFTYPNYWFGSWEEGDFYLNSNHGYEVEKRSGIYRFQIIPLYLLYFVGTYMAFDVMIKKNMRNLMFFGIILLGIYLEQFRFNMVCFFICWVWLNLKIYKKKISYPQIILFLFVLLLLYLNFNTLFGELVEHTKNEMTDQNIRVLSSTFYLLEYWKGPFTLFMGNGIPGGSSYGREIEYYQETFCFYRVDAGIIGTINTFGLVMLLFIFLYVYKLFKYWKYIDLPLKTFLVWLILMSPLYFLVNYSSDVNLFLAALLYLIDRSIIRNMRLISINK